MRVQMVVKDDAGGRPIDAELTQETQLDPARELYAIAWLLYCLARDTEIEVRRQVSAWSSQRTITEV